MTDPTTRLNVALEGRYRIVQPRLASHGPTLFAGLSKYVDLKLLGRRAFASGAVALRYEPVR